MLLYSEAVKTDVARRMNPPHKQIVVQTLAESCIYVVTLFNWSKEWHLKVEVVHILLQSAQRLDVDVNQVTRSVSHVTLHR